VAAQIVTELYETWFSATLRFAARSLGNLELAEEVVQEAFFDLYKELRKGRSVEKPRAWVMRVVRRRIWRQFAARPDDQLGHESLDILEATAVMDNLGAEDLGELALMMQHVTRREEEALLLRVAGMGNKEIADELGLAPGTVGTLLSRALRKMQAAAQKPAEQQRRKAHGKAADSQALQ
jgi:RNA polymerase sigma-70 factor (ECF subfamily)